MKKNTKSLAATLGGGSAFAIVIAIAALFSFVFSGDKNEDRITLSEYDSCPFFVSFVDVGQGDCSLISCEGVNILIDGGESEYSDDVLGYLDDLGIEYLDCYVLTHPHADHIGASAEIIDSIDIGMVFTTYFSEFNIPTTATYENVLISLENSDAEVVFVSAGETYTFGELELEILAPVEETSEYNDMSVVFKAQYKDTSVLFTGDATAKVERQILEAGCNIECDILKVGHHGSSTSTSEAFLDAAAPEIAVISCGRGNSYGHPHDEVIALLKSKAIRYQRTDDGGTVVCYGDGKNISMGVLG